jgi:Protein of unknown function (DUF2750)
VSLAASQAAAFYREVAASRVLWSLEDALGYPAPMTASGLRAQPFWSSRRRAENIVSTVAAYAGFEPFEIRWDDFVATWVPDMEKDGLLVGANWSGPRATGYDITARECVRNVEGVDKLRL